MPLDAPETWHIAVDARNWLCHESSDQGITLADVLQVDADAIRKAIRREFSERLWASLRMPGHYAWWKYLWQALVAQRAENEAEAMEAVAA